MVNKEQDRKSKKVTIVPIIVVFSGFQTRICIFSINSISNNNQQLLQDLYMWCFGKHAQSSTSSCSVHLIVTPKVFLSSSLHKICVTILDTSPAYAGPPTD